MVAFAVWLVYLIGTEVLRATKQGHDVVTARAKWLAAASLAAWASLIIAGRLLEYTHKWELLGIRAVT